MIVAWYDPTGTLIQRRPEVTLPWVGMRVVVRERDTSTSIYRVGEIEWRLVRHAPGREFFSLTDANEADVRIDLIEAEEVP